MKSGSVKSMALLAAAGAAAYVAWRAMQGGVNVLAGVQQAAAQAAANVQSAWENNVAGPFQRGQDYMAGVPPVVSSKAWLYDDYAYTGKDASGQPLTDGEWYGNADARRYDYDQRQNGTPPAATSNNGAAFGIYPNVFSNAARAADARQIDRILERERGYS